MIPILFDLTYNDTYKTNGVGRLVDALSCTVTEELNGAYTLDMNYPISGQHWQEIEIARVILASANALDQPQPFIIKRIRKSMAGGIQIYAEHVSYLLSNIPVAPFAAGTSFAAIERLKSNSAIKNPFTFSTDIRKTAFFKFDIPRSSRSVLGDTENSLVSVYGGELHFDRWNVKLLKHRGSESGITIRYGKNLIGYESQREANNLIAGIYPYYSRKLDGATTYDGESGKILVNGLQVGKDVEMDQSLTKPGVAADAKAVGDAIDSLVESVNTVLKSIVGGDAE